MFSKNKIGEELGMATRPRIIGARSYEDFQPSSDLLQEETREILTINLPGFRKDQIRVQMDDRSGFVMISGERPVGNNKWNRFRKSLRVPTNCNTQEIQAKFENAVLKITMPIKTGDKKQEQLVPKSDQTPKPIPTPPPQPSQQSVPDLKPTPTLPLPPSQKPIIEPKPTLIVQSPPTRKPITEPKPTLILQSPPTRKPVIEPKPTLTIQSPPSQKPTTTLLTPPSQKPINEPIPKPMPQPQPSERLKTTPAPQHPLIEKITNSKPTPIPQASLSQERLPLAQKETTETKQTLNPKLILGQILFGNKSKNDNSQDDISIDHQKKAPSSNIVEKEIDLMKTGKAEKEESGAQKIVKEKKRIDGLNATNEKQEKNREITEAQITKNGIKGNVRHGAEDQKNGSRMVSMELSDSTPYILNMVAAVLVVAALVAYIKYTIKTPW
ncbi:hypothetical protein IFM89_006759 [Coptis chinensis]|uniref:SHSP domain-containing protein n=1 Tax=Coptis chinensis TaxID=261450 RepID=A0A835I817_9MAGN|nr:hypothetical protein IFM89_006759 [Coptis chinensis]